MRNWRAKRPVGVAFPLCVIHLPHLSPRPALLPPGVKLTLDIATTLLVVCRRDAEEEEKKLEHSSVNERGRPREAKRQTHSSFKASRASCSLAFRYFSKLFMLKVDRMLVK